MLLMIMKYVKPLQWMKIKQIKVEYQELRPKHIHKVIGA